MTISLQNKDVVLDWKLAKNLLQEADVLLFRDKCWTSYFIQRYGHTVYNHVALASQHNGVDSMWELIEFHGITGGRTVSLERILNMHISTIDVYRPNPTITNMVFNSDTLSTDKQETKCQYKNITKTMRELTGQAYGWRRIWCLAQWYVPILRMFYNVNDIMDDNQTKLIYPVCSTTVSYAFSHNGYDLLKRRCDNWVQPGDIALSPHLNYLFTLV